MGLWKRYRDRRVNLRVEASVVAHFWVVDALSQTYLTPQVPARLVNLSEDGCCLAVKNLLLEGFHLLHCLQNPDDYQLEIAIQAPGGGTWLVRAVVRWTDRELEETDFAFRVGTKFAGPVALPHNWRRLLKRQEPTVSHMPLEEESPT